MDARYANTYCRLVRRFFINHRDFTKHVSRDDENKIKLSTPGQTLELASKNHRMHVLSGIK